MAEQAEPGEMAEEADGAERPPRSPLPRSVIVARDGCVSRRPAHARWTWRERCRAGYLRDGAPRDGQALAGAAARTRRGPLFPLGVLFGLNMADELD